MAGTSQRPSSGGGGQGLQEIQTPQKNSALDLGRQPFLNPEGWTSIWARVDISAVPLKTSFLGGVYFYLDWCLGGFRGWTSIQGGT